MSISKCRISNSYPRQCHIQHILHQLWILISSILFLLVITNPLAINSLSRNIKCIILIILFNFLNKTTLTIRASLFIVFKNLLAQGYLFLTSMAPMSSIRNLIIIKIWISPAKLFFSKRLSTKCCDSPVQLSQNFLILNLFSLICCQILSLLTYLWSIPLKISHTSPENSLLSRMIFLGRYVSSSGIILVI